MAIKNSPLEHALVRSSVRLEAGLDDSNFCSTGTGFFYQVTHPETSLAKVLILTNKHVVHGAQVVRFVLSFAPSVTDLNVEHQPYGRSDQIVILHLAGNLVSHPDPETDLCGIDITVPYSNVINSGNQVRSMCLSSKWLLGAGDRASVRDIEQVLVVGYPAGLWDSHNNMPVARIGTTATHALGCYSGKRNFLVDVAAYPGSSGSPVFTYESPMFRQPDGSFSPGTKASFIGVVWGVIERSVTGELIPIEIPSAVAQVPVIKSSLNLAIALHADAVRDIDKLVLPSLSSSSSV